MAGIKNDVTLRAPVRGACANGPSQGTPMLHNTLALGFALYIRIQKDIDIQFSQQPYCVGDKPCSIAAVSGSLPPIGQTATGE